MSSDINNIKFRKRSNLSLEKFLSSLKETQKKTLTPLVSSFAPKTTRKTVYISAGGKYSKYEDFIRVYTYRTGYVPIHPISTLGYYVASLGHQHCKKEIVRDCFSLLLNSDELWVFDETIPFEISEDSKKTGRLNELPEGVLAEIQYWLTYKKNSPLRFFSFSDADVPKYSIRNEWTLINDEIKKGEVDNIEDARTFAVIDLGSSTVKLTICGTDDSGGTKVILKKAITVNLAEGFFDDNKLKSSAIKRSVQAIADFQKVALNYGVYNIKLVGTGVVRKAKNLKTLEDEIKIKINLNLDVITADREAKLIYSAVAQDFQEVNNLVVINAGGGSTEITIGNGKKPEKVYSLQLGISDLNEKFTKKLPLKFDNYDNIRNHIRKQLEENIKTSKDKHTLVYTGGELDYMIITGFPLESRSGSIDHPKKISRSNFEEYSLKMAKLTRKKLHSFMPDNPRWMDGSISSNAMLSTIASYFRVEEIIPSNKNLNDGILLEMSN